MRHPAILVAAVLLAAAATCAQAADAPVTVRLSNARCLDGKPIDPRLEPVVIHVGGRAYVINVASADNAVALRKMDPVEALRAIVATNRDIAGSVTLPERAKAP